MIIFNIMKALNIFEEFLILLFIVLFLSKLSFLSLTNVNLYLNCVIDDLLFVFNFSFMIL